MALKVPIVTNHGLKLNDSYHKIIHYSVATPVEGGKPQMRDSLGNEMDGNKTVRFRVAVYVNEEARRLEAPRRDPIGEPVEYLMELNGNMLLEEQGYEFLKLQRGYEESVDV